MNVKVSFTTLQAILTAEVLHLNYCFKHAFSASGVCAILARVWCLILTSEALTSFNGTFDHITEWVDSLSRWGDQLIYHLLQKLAPRWCARKISELEQMRWWPHIQQLWKTLSEESSRCKKHCLTPGIKYDERASDLMCQQLTPLHYSTYSCRVWV